MYNYTKSIAPLPPSPPPSHPHTLSTSPPHPHTHSYLRSPSEGQPCAEKFFKAVSKLGCGLRLLLKGAPGGSDNLATDYIQSCGGHTKIVLQCLVRGTTCIRKLGEGGGMRDDRLLITLSEFP